MIIYAIVEKATLYILDDLGFTLDETSSTRIITSAYRGDCDAREEIVHRLRSLWGIEKGRGCTMDPTGTLDRAIIDIRTGWRGRIKYHDPNGQQGNLHEVEYIIRRLDLK